MNETECAQIKNRALKDYRAGNYGKALPAYLRIYPYAMGTTKKKIEHYIGLCHYSMQEYGLALNWYDRSLSGGTYKASIFDKCLAMLQQGDINGFDHYYGRYIINSETSVRFPNLPIKKAVELGEIVDQNVMVLNEQGFGDEFMFSLSHAHLNERCKSAMVQVYPETAPYFNTVEHTRIRYFTERSFDLEFVNRFDCWIPAGDLFVLCLRNGTLKNYGGGLRRFGHVNTKGKVGVCTSGNPRSPNYKERRVDEQVFAFIRDGINLNPAVKSKLFENVSLATFGDTVTEMRKCRCIVTVDTVIANIAGVLGLPTYLMHKGFLDWRYKFDIYESVMSLHDPTLLKEILSISD